MDGEGQSLLRQRKKISTEGKDATADAVDETTSPEEAVWGKTPGGEGKCSPTEFFMTHILSFSLVFRVPTTHDVLTLFNPSYPKSHIDMLNLGLLGLQIVLFLCISRSASRIFFLVYFAFWRAAYDVGLGWVLTKQSKKKWIVREIQRLGWLDDSRKPAVRNWIRKQLAGKMGKDYSFDVCCSLLSLS